MYIYIVVTYFVFYLHTFIVAVNIFLLIFACCIANKENDRRVRDRERGWPLMFFTDFIIIKNFSNTFVAIYC